MTWNTPGKSNANNHDTPPDLDEVLRQLQSKLKKLWGNRSPNQGFLPKFQQDFTTVAISFVAIVLLAIWSMSGFFIVSPSERAVTLLFGKYNGTLEPGLHWVPPLIERSIIINVQQVLTFPYHAEMLTRDENIVSVDLAVQYRITNLQHYLFNVHDAVDSLHQATASALRQVIGQTTLDEVLTSGREMVRQKTIAILEKTLQRYHAGLLIMDVNMQPIKPPEEVTAAFDDAIKAREDEQRFKNQAISYANQVIPTAQGKAARLTAEAKAYQQAVILRAQGETAQYLALLPEYQKAPEVTKERLYLESLQTILAQTPKVLLDTGNAANVIYLPLDFNKNKNATVQKPSIPLALPNLSPVKKNAIIDQQTHRPDYASAGE